MYICHRISDFVSVASNIIVTYITTELIHTVNINYYDTTKKSYYLSIFLGLIEFALSLRKLKDDVHVQKPKFLFPTF